MKYSLGEELFFLENNGVIKGKVVARRYSDKIIRGQIASDTYNCIKDWPDEMVYVLEKPFNQVSTVSEKSLFGTKEELLKSL